MSLLWFLETSLIVSMVPIMTLYLTYNNNIKQNSYEYKIVTKTNIATCEFIHYPNALTKHKPLYKEWFSI